MIFDAKTNTLCFYQSSPSLSLAGTSMTLGFSMIRAVLSPFSTMPMIHAWWPSCCSISWKSKISYKSCENDFFSTLWGHLSKHWNHSTRHDRLQRKQVNSIPCRMRRLFLLANRLGGLHWFLPSSLASIWTWFHRPFKRKLMNVSMYLWFSTRGLLKANS